MRAISLFVLALTVLTACAGTERPLRDLRSSGGGPDEFAVIPQRPLVIPQTLTLPEPTPGGTNLADPDPNADAIAALGGNAAAQRAGGVPAGDAALVTHAGRYGVDPAIRAELAAQDKAFRTRRSRANVFNPLGRDRYFPAYARQALDARAELARLRGLGIAVPTPVIAQPQAEARTPVAPQQTETIEAEAEPGLLQRTLNPVIERILGRDGPAQDASVPQNCVFTTAGPGSELRRVCTPVDAEGS